MSDVKYVVHYGVPFDEKQKSFDSKEQAEKFINDHVFIGLSYINKDGSVKSVNSDTIYLEKTEKLDAPFTVVSSKDPAAEKCTEVLPHVLDRKEYEKAGSEKTESFDVSSACDKILAGENIESAII